MLMRFSYLIETLARRNRRHDELVKALIKRNKIETEDDAPELRYLDDEIERMERIYRCLSNQVEGMTILLMIPEFVSYNSSEYGLDDLWSQEQLDINNRLHTAARIVNRRYNGNVPEDVMERLVEWVTGMPVDKGEDMMTLTKAN